MVKTDFTLEYWRARAEEARVIADQLCHPQAKQSLVRVAEGYDHLADRYEASSRSERTVQQELKS